MADLDRYKLSGADQLEYLGAPDANSVGDGLNIVEATHFSSFIRNGNKLLPGRCSVPGMLVVYSRNRLHKYWPAHHDSLMFASKQ